MVSSGVVKSTTLVALKGNWLKCCVCGMMCICTWLIISLTAGTVSRAVGEVGSTILSVLMYIGVLAPLLLGVLRFFWRMLCGAQDHVIIAFHYFSSLSLYRRAEKMILNLTLRTLLFGILLFIPAILVELFSGTWIYDITGMAIPMWISGLNSLIVFLKASAGVILFFVMLRYYLAPMLLVADENMEPDEAIHMSGEIRKDTLLEFILLILSLAGWILLSVLMIPLIFTVPYMLTLYLVHCRFAVANYNKFISRYSGSDVPTFSAEI